MTGTPEPRPFSAEHDALYAEYLGAGAPGSWEQWLAARPAEQDKTLLNLRQQAETAALAARQKAERAAFEDAEWNRAVGYHRDNHGDTPVRACPHCGCQAAFEEYTSWAGRDFSGPPASPDPEA